MMQFTHYCIIRNDLPPGVVAAQLVHAAGESSMGNLPPHTKAVVLSVDSEEDLKNLEVKLAKANLPHRAIREPDHPWNGQLMAIGLEPTGRNKVKKILYNLNLFN